MTPSLSPRSEELGLTPNLSRAYVALLRHGIRHGLRDRLAGERPATQDL